MPIDNPLPEQDRPAQSGPSSAPDIPIVVRGWKGSDSASRRGVFDVLFGAAGTAAFRCGWAMSSKPGGGGIMAVWGGMTRSKRVTANTPKR